METAPGGLGFTMPPEWAVHEATWLAFPHHRTDWPAKLAAMPYVFAEAARVISLKERVRLLVEDPRMRDRAADVFERAGVDLLQVDFIVQPTNRSWLRDTMPLWVTRRGQPSTAVNYRFDGWARYRDHGRDDAAGQAVARRYSEQYFEPLDSSGRRLVLEGGSIDVDETGTLLTTEECLLTSPRARFRGWSKDAVEQSLALHLGIRRVIWAPTGIVGDDTSGHIDDFARFAPGGKLLVCREPRRRDENHRPLAAAWRALEGSVNARGQQLELVPLPMPAPVTYEGERLPASYANFYVCNAAVLVPTFNDPADREALSILADCFTDRPVVGVHARDLVAGLGTWHCSTMQQPRP